MGEWGTDNRTSGIVPDVCGRDPRVPSMAKKKGPLDALGLTHSDTKPLFLTHTLGRKAVWAVSLDSSVTSGRRKVLTPTTPQMLMIVPAKGEPNGTGELQCSNMTGFSGNSRRGSSLGVGDVAGEWGAR